MKTQLITLSTGAVAKFAVAPSKKSLPGILIVHGWKSDPFKETGTYEQIQNTLVHAGYACLILCLRGHIPALGDINTLTREDHLADMRCGIKLLGEIPEVASVVGACGTSYGAYLLGILCAEVKFSLLALRAPALYPDTGWTQPSELVIAWPDLKAWRSVIHKATESHALWGMTLFKGDMAIFPSELDGSMPPAVSDSYLEATVQARTTNKIIIEGARHTLNEVEKKIFLSKLRFWFISHYPSLL